MALRYCEVCGALIPAKEARRADATFAFICPRCFENRKAVVASGSDSGLEMKRQGALGEDVKFGCIGCKRQLRRKRVATAKTIKCPSCETMQTLHPDGRTEALASGPVDPGDGSSAQVDEYLAGEDLQLELEESSEEERQPPPAPSSGRTKQAVARRKAPTRRGISSKRKAARAEPTPAPESEDLPQESAPEESSDAAFAPLPRSRRWPRVLLIIAVVLPLALAGALLAGTLPADGFARQGSLGGWIERCEQTVERGLTQLAERGWLRPPADTLGGTAPPADTLAPHD